MDKMGINRNFRFGPLSRASYAFPALAKANLAPERPQEIAGFVPMARFRPARIYLASFEYLGGRDLALPSNRGWSRDNNPAPTVASAKLPASIARGNS